MRLEERITIAAPREEVWELIADPAKYPSLFEGMVRCDPEDPSREPGVRARYEMRLQIGSAEIGGDTEIVEYDAPYELAWTSVTGIDHRGRLRLREDGDVQTKLTLRWSYGAPGGLLGAAVEYIAAPQLRANMKATLQNLKHEAEGTDRPAGGGRGVPAKVLHEVGSLKLLADTGIVSPMRPDKLARLGVAFVRWGRVPAMGVIAGAVRHPDRDMVIDEAGELTYRDVDRRTNAIARALADAGVAEGDRVGIMCRNHRGFVEATLAVSKLGADALLLNTSFAAPQLADVAKREQAAALIYDEEFTELVREAGKRRRRFLAWHDSDKPSEPTLEQLAREGDQSSLPAPGRVGRITILTSGTTGTPKGAARGAPNSLDPAVALFERIPLHEGQISCIAAPLFHGWGFAHFGFGMVLGATMVLRRKFDPEKVLQDIETSRCEVLVVVPVMLQRILELPEEVRRKYDTSSLRAVCASGSALPGDLAIRWMDEFGDNLYNLYGSTEVMWATIATPADMRAARGTAGRPVRGTVVKLFDRDGREVRQGQTARIFVGNENLFEGYTGGGTKDTIGGLMATGDVGRFDEAGRLFVEGRDDEMIVSGGENVFPKEVEDLLSRHDAVAEAAAIGVDDEHFGQRLRAFVVPKPGKQVGEDELKEYVRDNLARYKVPREVVFLDELPRNPTGKVLKRALREMETPSGVG